MKVRLAILEALARAMRSCAGDDLVQALRTDRSPVVRLRAIKLLRGLTGWRDVTALISALKHEPHPRVRRALVAALARMSAGDDVLNTLAETLLSDPHPAVRAAAVTAVRSVRADSVARARLLCQTVARDADAGVRRRAWRALKQFAPVAHLGSILQGEDALSPPQLRHARA